jgi:hypothetical protein
VDEPGVEELPQALVRRPPGTPEVEPGELPGRDESHLGQSFEKPAIAFGDTDASARLTHGALLPGADR